MNTTKSFITQRTGVARYTLITLAIAVSLAWSNVWNGSADTDWYNATETTFTITTAEQLAGLASLVISGNDFSGKTIELGTDIVLNDVTDWESWDESTADLNPWTPIGYGGYDDNSFNGAFDGKGHNVSGIYVDGKARDVYGIFISSTYKGLFGSIESNGSVKNVGVVASYIKGRSGVGGVTGVNYGIVENCYFAGMASGATSIGGVVGENKESGIVKNSYSSGMVSGTGDAQIRSIGGVVGYNDGGTIESCYFTGTAEGGEQVGGVVGGSYGTIESSYSTGTVSGTNSVGGVVGRNTYAGDVYGKVSNSYSTGEVSGTGTWIGGVVGNNGGIIANCYSTASVSSTSNQVGGVVGMNHRIVENCYFTGTVSGTSSVGGVLGFHQDGSIAKSYWNTDNHNRGVGTTSQTGATGMTADEMKSADFVATLNAFVNEKNAEQTDIVYALWKQDEESVNQGYPILDLPESQITPIIANRENRIIGAIGVQTIYYDLKGTPLGAIKPTTPGVYIEKQGKLTKRIVVR
ncbi:MAG: hypothetical protein FWH22_07455 [Fibromonadales bacterium]|nr:hypothetical protein [Fibromonadales bacterium]